MRIVLSIGLAVLALALALPGASSTPEDFIPNGSGTTTGVSSSKSHRTYSEEEVRTAHARLLAVGYDVTLSETRQYLESPPHTPGEIIEFLAEFGVDVSSYTESLIEQARIYEPDILLGLDAGITVTRAFYYTTLSTPPDYSKAWEIIQEEMTDVTWVNLLRTTFWPLGSAYELFEVARGTITLTAFIIDRAGIASQMRYYLGWCDTRHVSAPYEDEVACCYGDPQGYLLSPWPAQYYEIAIPFSTDVFTPSVMQGMAEANYALWSGKQDLENAVGEAVAEAKSALDPLALLLAEYEAGQYTIMVDQGSGAAVVGNSGPVSIQNLILRNQRPLLPDEETDPILVLLSGAKVVIPLQGEMEFQDIDELVFGMEGIEVTVNASTVTRPMVGNCRVFPVDDGHNEVAPQTVWVESQVVPDLAIYSYEIDFGDGTPAIFGESTAGGFIQSPTHTYLHPGSFLVTLRIEDAASSWILVQTEVRLDNPIIMDRELTSNPIVPGPSHSFPLTAGGTYDIEGDNLTYEWDFDYDGTSFDVSESGHDVPFAAGEVGEYVIALRCRRADGISQLASKSLHVQNPSVAILENLPFEGTPPLTVSLNGGNSYSSNGGTITSWDWDFGDGFQATGPTAAHEFASSGSFTVELTVTDHRGFQSSVSQPIVLSTGGPTEFTSDVVVSGSATWRKYDSPFLIHGNVTVLTGATLTIEPGTEVYFAGGKGLHAYGTLTVFGTPLEKVNLGSLDTLQGPPVPWTGLSVSTGSVPTLSWVEISDAQVGIRMDRLT
ncbi:MAG: PKD domain-containing protein, partial [Candidatus Zixiibacteriota bacterium]